MCSLDADRRQLLLSTFTYAVDLLKLTFGCLLSVVVPQRCTQRSDEICTLYDNFFELIPYNVFTLTYNFITMACLIGFYTVEYRREKWCIEYLDTQSDPSPSLEHALKRYPTLFGTLLQYNRYYYGLACLSAVVVATNLLSSSVLVFYYYYLDYRSITALITNSLLVIEKLYTSYHIARESNEERCAISAYLIVPILYHTIDEDHRKPPFPPTPSSFRVQVNHATFQTILELYHRPTKK